MNAEVKLLVVCTLTLIAGCQSRTDYGSCIGLGEKQNPALRYRLSARNIAIGVVFIELIVPPIVVATDETFCPVGPADGT